MTKYGSTVDTQEHINRVCRYLLDAADRLRQRAVVHDASKLADPEKAIFDQVTPRLRGLTYGSDEYKASLAEMKPALDHHYAHNSHHPEHYPNGIDDMDLLDMVEMMCDWKAATERHADGDYGRSLNINRERFKIEPQTFSIMVETAKHLGFVPNDWQSS